MGVRRKQISFDLDTDICKKILGEEQYTKAYKDIRSFFERNNCLHIEGSVYMSNHEMNNARTVRLLKKLLTEHPYLSKCIKEIHQADVSNVHSLNQYFSYDGTPGKYEREPPEKPSVREQLKRNKEAIQEKDRDSGDRESSRHDIEFLR